MGFGARVIMTGTILAGVGGWFGWKLLYAPASVYVVAPRGASVGVSVDGNALAATETLDNHRIYFVKKGPHTVEVTADETREYALRVSDGFDHWVVPVRDDQCFVLVDVSESHFGARDVRPKVTQHFPAKQAFRIPARTYLSLASLPSSRKRRQRIHLLVDVRCDSDPQDDLRIAEGLMR